MKFIAHRGNINGPNPERENTLDYLKESLALGFDVEVDVRLVNGKFYLGHDEPKEEITIDFLKNKKVWSHAKNLEAYYELIKHSNINCFWQDTDLLALTSKGFIWGHSDCSLFSERNIITKLDFDAELLLYQGAFGICSDYVEEYSNFYTDYSYKTIADKLPFKLLVIDIDGVMTTGKKLYGLKGEVLAKEYCDKDFTAIKRFKAAGIKVCFLSGDRTVNEAMAEIRQIDFHDARDMHTGNIDKSWWVDLLADKYKVTVDRIAYIGDDYYDLSIIESLKYTYCPEDAIQDIKNSVYKVLRTRGGEGVIAELYDIYKDQIDYVFPTDSFAQNNKP